MSSTWSCLDNAVGMYPSMRGDGPEDYEVVEGSVLTVTREVEVGGCGRSYGDNLSNLHQTSPNLLAMINSIQISTNSKTGSWESKGFLGFPILKHAQKKVWVWYCMLLVLTQALFRMDAYWYPVFEDCVPWYDRSIVSMSLLYIYINISETCVPSNQLKYLSWV